MRLLSHTENFKAFEYSFLVYPKIPSKSWYKSGYKKYYKDQVFFLAHRRKNKFLINDKRRNPQKSRYQWSIFSHSDAFSASVEVHLPQRNAILPAGFRNISVVGAFSPLMTNFYCQAVHLIFSLKFPFLYFFPLFLLTKQNIFFPSLVFPSFKYCELLSHTTLAYHFAKLKAPFSPPKLTFLLYRYLHVWTSLLHISVLMRCLTLNQALCTHRRCHILKGELHNNQLGSRFENCSTYCVSACTSNEQQTTMNFPQF